MIRNKIHVKRQSCCSLASVMQGRRQDTSASHRVPDTDPRALSISRHVGHVAPTTKGCSINRLKLPQHLTFSWLAADWEAKTNPPKTSGPEAQH